MFQQIRHIIVPLIFLIICMLFTGLYVQAEPSATPATGKQETISDFSFLQMTDSHISPFFSMPSDFSKLRSYSCVRAIKDVGACELQGYGVQAPAPSFIIHTGDLTEFGIPGVVEEVIAKYFEGYTLPIYFQAGNHDNTWVASMQLLRDLYGGTNYSFDYGGCHFVGLNSASIQEPVPSIGEEVIGSLKVDLQNVHSNTPVFVYLHHPLDSGEFCSSYDTGRLLDTLRSHNVVLILDGHGHSVVHQDFSGIDGVMGGATFTKKDPTNGGFNVLYIKDNVLYVEYKEVGEADSAKPLLKKRIPSSYHYPTIQFKSPEDKQVVQGESLNIEATIEETGFPWAKARYNIDDEHKGEMTLSGRTARVSIKTNTLCNGAHFICVEFENISQKTFKKHATFYVENPSPTMGTSQWRFQMTGSSKATPLVNKGTVYVGAQDGLFYALDEKTGALKWSVNTEAEILSSAAVYNDLILCGAGNGLFFALTPEGKVSWFVKRDYPVYSSPVVDEKGVVYFGTNNAELVALDAANGDQRWVNSDARFSIESQPFVTNRHVYFGAWDGYVYCVDKETGETLWKQAGPRNRERVITYYGPADNGPVVSGDTLFIADRGYKAARYSASDGSFLGKVSESCSGVALSEDRQAVYLRGVSDPLKKISLDGKEIWSCSIVPGRMPVSPTEKDGILYVCTNSGRLHAFDAKTGTEKWQYQVTPQLYVMSAVTVNDGVVFTTGMDGVVTAVSPPNSVAE